MDVPILVSTRIIEGCVLDVLPLMEAGSIHMCATSPPFYGLRLYDGETSEWPTVSYAPMAGLPEVEVEAWTGQLGLEPTPEMYVGHLVAVFRLVRRVLRDDGMLWLNLGDSFASKAGGYDTNGSRGSSARISAKTQAAVVSHRGRKPPAGLKEKDIIGIPWRVAFALQADGWWLRSEIIWHKPNPMPESVSDRPTKAHEQVFLLTKSVHYFWDQEAVREKEARQWSGKHNGQMWSSRETEGVVLGRKEAPNCGLENSGSNSAGRNVRSVWKIATEPSTRAHYAGWPSRLVAPMVKAGTSERGVCGACGAPYERVVERHRKGKDWNRNNRSVGDRMVVGQSASDSMPDNYKPPTTLGWRPTCSCEAAEPIPATVLDIFAGTGTTADVARRLGRYAVVIDRSAAYAKMQRERLAQHELF